MFDLVDDFYLENSVSNINVDKIVFCIGTNDIKYFKPFRKNSVHTKFYNELSELINHTKLLFPTAMIIFRTVIPIRNVNNYYTVDVVHDFNYLLLDICRKRGCVFYDCFSDFLGQGDMDIDDRLYRDNLHLNAKGVGILCRSMKYVIFKDIYNPFCM